MNRIILLLAAAVLLFSACNKSSKDPDPNDRSDCRYEFQYKLSYSEIDPDRPVYLIYLDADRQEQSLQLTDTSLEFKVTYKYGDSLYVRFSHPDIYFRERTYNTVTSSYSLRNSAGGSSCPGISRMDETSLSSTGAAISTSSFEIAPQVVE